MHEIKYRYVTRSDVERFLYALYGRRDILLDGVADWCATRRSSYVGVGAYCVSEVTGGQLHLLIATGKERRVNDQ